jgi:hypothetical protein
VESGLKEKVASRDLERPYDLGRQRDGNGYQYNKSLKRIEQLQYMNNLVIVLALFTTPLSPHHRFSRLDTTAAFQAATSATSNWVQQNSYPGFQSLRQY